MICLLTTLKQKAALLEPDQLAQLCIPAWQLLALRPLHSAQSSRCRLWARWPFTTTVLSRDTTGTLPLTHRAYKEHYASVAKGGVQFASSPGGPQ